MKASSPKIKVSVIVTNYQDARWVGRAIDSVLSQEGVLYELIIVDDGSTDGSREIIRARSLDDPRVSIILLDRNCGISEARNLGMAKAQGTYITFLDSDDALVPGSLKLRTLIFEEILNIFPEVCMMIGDAFLINENEVIKGRYMNTSFQGRVMTGDSVSKDQSELLTERIQSSFGLSLLSELSEAPGWCLPSTYFFKRENHAIFDKRFRVGEACLFFERSRAIGRIAYLGVPWVYYRIKLRSVSNTQAEDTLRGMNAGAQSAKLGRLDNPITPEEMPPPSWSQVMAWKHGRNAKAAWCNDRPIRACWELLLALMARPRDIFLRGFRFFQLRISG
jgi:glycosyltransferase involved in cell wall biosynthesis